MEYIGYVIAISLFLGFIGFMTNQLKKDQKQQNYRLNLINQIGKNRLDKGLLCVRF